MRFPPDAEEPLALTDVNTLNCRHEGGNDIWG
jgi:hypothetical protein